jgi:hypothetical protein
MAAGLALGAFTNVTSGTGFAAAWFALTALGLGVAMPSAMNAALGALSADRSGAGSALITAMRQVGATIGVAVLGTVLNNVYQAGWHPRRCPPRWPTWPRAASQRAWPSRTSSARRSC